MYFSYYELQIKMIQPLLATTPCADIAQDHIFSKNKKLIKAANSATSKLSKKIEKYLGDEISENKEYQEMCGIIRNFENILSRKIELPPTLPELMQLNKELMEECLEKNKENEIRSPNIFLKDKDGYPMLSTHVLLGNVKAIIRTIVNSKTGDDKKAYFFKSKTSMAECSALDFKCVEDFVRPSKDIVKSLAIREDGTEVMERVLNVRPLRYTNDHGKSVNIIAQNEQLPTGTEFKFTLRIRKGSPFDSLENLTEIFSYSKSMGLGAFRASGNYGGFCFKLKPLHGYVEVIEGCEGWN